VKTGTPGPSKGIAHRIAFRPKRTSKRGRRMTWARPSCTVEPMLRGTLLVGLTLTMAAAATAQERREPPTEAVELFTQARAHYEAGRYPEAAEDLERALTLDPGSPTLLFNLARVYELMGELDRAVEYGEAYLRMVPEEDTEERANAETMLRRLQGARDWLALRAQAEQHAAPSLRQLAPRIVVRDRGVADTAFWVTLGAGAGALAIGAALGGVALSLERDVNGRIITPSENLDDYARNLASDGKRADSLALTSDILMGIGGAAMLSALLMYVLRVRTYERDATEEELSVTLGIEGRQASLRLRGSF